MKSSELIKLILRAATEAGGIVQPRHLYDVRRAAFEEAMELADKDCKGVWRDKMLDALLARMTEV